MTILLIIAIITILVINDKYQNVKRENDNLKRNTSNYHPPISFCPKCGADLKNITFATRPSPSSINLTNPQPVSPNLNISNQKSKQVTTMTKEEKKNNLILITGAVLIVLSALIFLGSTWGSTGNLIKTFILLLMLLFFYIFSKISDKFFNLKQTSTVFFYITLCYLPIALLSISVFGLFGHYLSIYGSGKYIYFSICCLITSIIYLVTYQDKPTTFLKILIEFFLYFTVTFITLIYTNSIYLYSIVLTIYTIIREMLYLKNEKHDEKDKILFIILTIRTTLGILSLYLISIINNYYPLTLTIYTLLVITNLYFLLTQIYSLKKIYNILYPILSIIMVYFFANTSILLLPFYVKQSFIIISFIALILFDFKNYKSINQTTFIPISIASLFLTIASYNQTICPSIILSIYLIIAIINYLLSSKYKNILSFIPPTIIYFISISLKIDLKISLPIILIIPEIILLIPLFYKRLSSNYYYSSFIIGIIASTLSTIYLVFNPIKILTIILLFFLSIIYITYYFKKQEELSKYLSYTNLFIGICLLFNYLKVESFITYSLSLTIIVIIFLEQFIKQLETKNSYYFILISSIISLILLNFDLSLTRFLIIISMDLLLIYYKIINKKGNSLFYLTSISLIPHVFLSDILTIEDINYMIYIAITMISFITLLSYLYKNNKSFIIIPYLYLICSLIFYDISIYIIMSFFFIVGLINYLSHRQENIKDIFKFVIATSLLIIIENAIIDFEISELTILRIGSILIYILFLSRNIIKHHFNEYKFIEYFLTIIINIIALSTYADEIDGILYVSLLVMLVIFSELFKHGPIFLTSLIFIILNILILTREFWLSLPWWLYVLGIGMILVMFAMRNEAHINQRKDKIKKIKQDLDL